MLRISILIPLSSGLSMNEGSQRSSYNSWGGGNKATSVRSHGSAGTMSSSSPRSAPRGLIAPRPGGGPPSHGGSSGHGSGPPAYKGQHNPPPSYHSYLSGSTGSGSQRSGPPPVQQPGTHQPLQQPPHGSGKLARADSVSSLASVYSQHSILSMPGRPIGSLPPSVAGSQASFRMAMDNSMEYYSDAV